MLFNSFEFLFAFLPITFLLYFVLLKFHLYRTAATALIAASIFFYGYSNKYLLILLIGSITVNYLIGRAEATTVRGNIRRFLLIFGIVINLLLLGYFKYYNFTVSNINVLLGTNFNVRYIILPIGISFFTFQQISFLVDCYRRELEGVKFLSYGLMICFFPKILSGPLVINKEFMKQLDDRRNKTFNFSNISIGLYLFAIGLAKKVIIADYLAAIANNGFDGVGTLGFFVGWTTSLSYTFQLYFDFSGYCDMASGIAKMFNIELPANFNSPYKASSIKDFWNRWHMTLGAFLTKYVYIPLGGNRKGAAKTYRNLFLTFLISGLWHGSGWNFILWGAMHGAALVTHRFWSSKGHKLNKYLGWFITFNFVNAAWVFFRAANLDIAFKVLSAMLLPDYSIMSLFSLSDTVLMLTAASLLCIKTRNSYLRAENLKTNFLSIAFTVVCIVLSVMSLNKVSNFVYFSF